MRWPSAKFYQGQLIAAPSVANCSLSDMDSVETTEQTKSILYLVDTAKITGDKYEKKNNKSFLNEVEASFVMQHCLKLIGEHMINTNKIFDDFHRCWSEE